MSKIIVAGACGFLALSTAAWADVSGLVTSDGVKVVLGGGTPYSLTGQNVADQINVGGTNEYGNYQISTAISSNYIDFANNATTQGDDAYVSSSTSIAVTLKNTGLFPVAPVIQSTIAPGGFGVYVASPGANPTASPKTGVVANINQTPQNSFQTFSDFAAQGGPGSDLAGASFSLTIASDGVTIESFSGALIVSQTPREMGDPTPPATVTLIGGTGLSGFGLVTPTGSDSAVGFQWNATDIAAAFPVSQGMLDVGESRTLTYDTTVTAFTSAGGTIGACGGYQSCATLQSYSGFGDPIGKGKGGTPPAGAGLAALADGISPFDDSGISDVYFPQFELALPTFNSTTGLLSAPLVTNPTTGAPQELPSLPLSSMAVPEPQNWALMLVGMGLAGSGLRRRRARRLA
jgi:hypothetical protein